MQGGVEEGRVDGELRRGVALLLGQGDLGEEFLAAPPHRAQAAEDGAVG